MKNIRELVATAIIRNGYATGHGDTVEDMIEEVCWQANESDNPDHELIKLLRELCDVCLQSGDVEYKSVQKIATNLAKCAG